MELPFTIVFEAPSQSELRAAVRMRGLWVAGLALALAVGTTLVLVGPGGAGAAAPGSTLPLELRSRPPGASVWLDGHAQGRTPLTVPVGAGPHTAQFKTRDGLDAQYTLQAEGTASALDAVLWRREPALVRLRPALPGARLADARLLADGQLVLVVALPPDTVWGVWRLEPTAGTLEPLFAGAAGERIAVAPDGQHLAYLGYDVGPPAPATASAGARRASIVWQAVSAPGGALTGWRPALAPDEQLLDVSWSPAADRLLVVTARRLAGGTMASQLRLVDVRGFAATDVLSLPSAVVAGSEVWSPDGTRVAFMVHAAGLNALCLLDVGGGGGFRYLADLDLGSGRPLPYPSAAWSADSQQLLYVAPRQRSLGASLTWLQAQTQRALYVASSTDADPRLIGDTDVDQAVWREDGRIIGLGRLASDGGLDLRLIDPAAVDAGRHLLDLPLRPTATYASVWDVAHARLVIANPVPGGDVEYWLAMLGLERDR